MEIEAARAKARERVLAIGNLLTGSLQPDALDYALDLALQLERAIGAKDCLIDIMHCDDACDGGCELGATRESARAELDAVIKEVADGD